jgi:hypothetical protein
MRNSTCSEHQIAQALKRAEGGVPKGLCRGFSSATCYRRRSAYADLVLDHEILKDIVEQKL